MKKKETLLLVVIIFFAGMFSYIISKTLINPPEKRSAEVPVSEVIVSTFPDVQNEEAYQAFFNAQALDPTQLIVIGDNQNNKPFNNPQ